MNSVGIQLLEMSQNFSRIHLVPRSIFLRLDQATGAALIMQIGGSLGQGLLRPIQTVEGCKAHPQGPEPSATCLAPRALSAGVVDSLGDILADCTLWSLVLLGVGN